MVQDEDVLDTWFSSALWPFSTLGYPEKTKELEYFYPTSVLVTGYDIIFFWVARMIFSGLEHMGEVPFHNVLFHGIVRDSQGRKMSKSLGNGIDPLEVIDKYGADALRFTLATGNSPGNDMRFYYERVEASRNFANKIWNASRFALMNIDTSDLTLPENLALEDKWILSELNDLTKEVTENLDKFELGIAVSKLYDFIWDELCDWYIEIAKLRLYGDDKEANTNCQRVLIYVLTNTLKLLHPFMPFITEEIWQHLPHEGESIMISSFPEYKEELSFKNESRQMALLKEAIVAVRNRRSELSVVPSRKAALSIVTENASLYENNKAMFEKLASASSVTVLASKEGISDNDVAVITSDAQIFMPLSDLVDAEKELERLNSEKKTLEAELKRSEGMLSNTKFIEKAPQSKIDEEKQKYENYKAMYEKVLESIKNLV